MWWGRHTTAELVAVAVGHSAEAHRQRSAHQTEGLGAGWVGEVSEPRMQVAMSMPVSEPTTAGICAITVATSSVILSAPSSPSDEIMVTLPILESGPVKFA